MNHLYRSLWNDVTRTFVAVAEVASGRGKRSSGSRTAGTADAAAAPVVTLLRPMALEPRLMFDAAAVGTVVEAVHADKAFAPDAGHGAALAEAAQRLVQAAPPAVELARREVVFVDTSVADYRTLLAGLNDGVEVVLLDHDQDGVAQMADWAQSHSGYDAIHVISHGSEGRVLLGTARLDAQSAPGYGEALRQIGAALTADGDILLYGCDVGAGATGQSFLQSLASFTLADVAASTDATASPASGGDWMLERSTGSIEVALPFSAAAQNSFSGHLFSGTLTFGGATSDGTSLGTSVTDGEAGSSDISSVTIELFAANAGRSNLNHNWEFTTTGSNFTADGVWTVNGVEAYLVLRSTGSENFAFQGIKLAEYNVPPSGKSYTFAAYRDGSLVGSVTKSLDASAISTYGSSDFAAGTFGNVDEILITLPTNSVPIVNGIVIADVANAAPVATASGGTTAFTEGNNVSSSPVTIDSSLTLSDADNATLASGTVSISGGFQSGQDVLAFTNNPATMGNITGSYAAGTGVLSLSSPGATATVAQWQSALRSVTYTNSSDSPNTSNRTVSFAVSDGNSSNSATTKTVSVASVNDAPVATTSGGSTAFVEGNNVTSTPVAIDAGFTVSDLDNATLASATVAITGGLQSGEDVLAFTNNPATMGNITGSYTAGTGVLSLSSSGATATVTQWQAALRSVTYTNSSDTPNTGNRILSFTANDGTANGNTATRTVTIAATDDSAVVTASGGATSASGSTPVAVDSGIALSDADSSTLSSATVSITAGLQAGEDVLAFTNSNSATFGNITGSYTAGTGVLTLSSAGATAAVAQWRAALAAVAYANTAGTPTAGDRTVSFVVNDGTSNSAAGSKTVSVQNAPVLGSLGGDSVAWAGVGNAVVLDMGADATLSDVEFGALNGGNGNWAGGSLGVQRSDTAVAADGFDFNTSGALFTVSGSNLQSGGQTFATFTNTGGLLTISFTSSGTTATTALVRDVARHITYRNDTPAGDATLRFTLNDGSTSATADVTVTSDAIYVTNTSDTSTIDASDGTGLREAIAIAAADSTGSQTLILTSALAGQTVTLGSTLSLGESLTLDADAASGVIVTGSTLSLAGGTTLSFTHGGGDTATISSTLSGTGGLAKAGAGTLTLGSTSNNAGWSGAMSVTGGTLTASAGSNPATTLSSGTLTLDGGTLAMLVSGAAGTTSTLTNSVVLGAGGGTFNITGGGGANIANITGVVSGGALTKTGASMLQLSGNNTYTGSTQVSAGTLIANHANALGTTAGTTTVASGATLRLSGGLTVAEAITVAGTGTSGTNALELASGSTTLSGTVTLTADAVVNSATGATLTLSGLLSGGAQTLTKEGAGTLVLSNTGNYAGMSGGITANGGTLSISDGNHLSSGTLTLNGATLRDTNSAAHTLANAVVIGSGGATFNKTSSGTLTLSGALNGSGSITNVGAVVNHTGSGTLTLDGAGITTGASSALTLGSNVVLGTSGATFSAGTSANITLQGVVSGAGNYTKSGAGWLVFGGSNTYSGTQSITAGQLAMTAGASLGTGQIQLAAGTTLRFVSVGTVTVANNMVFSAGSVNITADNAGTSVVTLTGTRSESGGVANLTANAGTAAGSQLILGGSASYTGFTSLARAVSITDAGNVGTGALRLAGATLQITGSNAVFTQSMNPTNDSSIEVLNSATFAGVVSDIYKLTKLGAGTLALTGTNTHVGAFDVTAGTLALYGGASIGNGALVTVSAGATLALNASETIGSLAGAGTVALGSSTLTLASNANTTFSGGISGTGGLIKQGSGTLTLSGINTYTGSTTLGAGSLTLGGGAAVADSSAVVMSAGTTLTLAASETVGSLAGSGIVTLGSNTLTAGGDGSSTSFAGAVGGTGGFTKAGSGTLTLTGANTYTGATTVSAGTLAADRAGGAIADASAVTVASGAHLQVQQDEVIASLDGAGALTLNGYLLLGGGASTTVSGQLSGSGALYVDGGGTLTLSGSNSASYTGVILVRFGSTLSIAGDANLGSGQVSLNDGTLTLTGSDAVDNAIDLANQGVIQVGNGLALTLTGALGGWGGLSKSGSGTLTLGSGNYGGTTTVDAGTLQVTGTLDSGADITVASGATLGGTGTLFTTGGKVVNVLAGGTLAPGVAGVGHGIGQLTINGGLRVNGTIAAQIAGAPGTAGVDFDQLVVNGAVALNGGTLSVAVVNGHALVNGDVYRLIDNDGSDAFAGSTGAFTGVLEGVRQDIGGQTYRASYLGGTGNDFTLTVANNTPPVMAQLGGDSQAYTAGSTVRLDVGGDAAVSDTEDDAVNWNGGSLVVRRVTSGVADATAHDQFGFDLAGAGFTVSGNSLQSGGQAFATFTNTGGVLTISFTGSGTAATSALVQELVRRISYRNDTPYGDATIRLTLTDSLGGSTASDVTLTSSTIYADVSNDDAGGDAADGFSLREALARAAAQGGADVVRVVLADNSTITLGSGVTTGAGDTLDLGSANGLTITGGTLTLGGALTLTSSGDATLASTLAGNATLTKAGGGTLALSSSSNASSFSGSTVVTGGAVAVADGFQLGGALALNGGQLTITASGPFFNAISIGANGGVISNSGTVMLGGAISGTGLLQKQGAGTLTLDNTANATGFSGGTLVRAGTLAIGSDAQLGAGLLTLNGGHLSVTASGNVDNAIALLADATVSVAPSAGLTLSGALSGSGKLIVDGSGDSTVSLTNTGNATSHTGATEVRHVTLHVLGDAALGAGVLTLNGGTLSVGLAGTLDNAIDVSVNGGTVEAAAAVTLSGTLGGSGVLNVIGSTGSVALTSTGNAANFSGGIAVRNSTLRIADDANLGSGAVSLNGGTLTLAAGAAIDNVLGLGGLGGVVQVDAGQASLDGAIVGGGPLAKAGQGVLTISGAGSYAGGTTVQAGSLRVTGALSGTASLTVADGATLAGTGSIGTAGSNGFVVVQAGGALAPGLGAGSTGTLTLRNGLTLMAGAQLRAEVRGSSAGSGYDQVVVEGSVNLNGGTLTLDLGGYQATAGEVYRLIDNDGADAVINTFGGVAQGARIAVGMGRELQMSYAGGSGNDVVLTALNAVPTVANVPGAQVAAEDSAFAFTLPANTFADIDVSDTLSYAATLADGSPLPAWLSFDAATRSFSGTPLNGDVGAITVKVTATDASSASASSNFMLTVANTNDAPTSAAIAAQTATEDGAFNFQVPATSFADVDVGDTLSYTATLANGAALPAWLSFNATTRTFSGTPLNSDVGAITVKVTATDGSGATASSNFALTVVNTNDAPVAGPIPFQSVAEDSAFVFTVPASTFTDVDVGDTLAYTATLANGAPLPDWLSFDAATRTFTGTPANGDVGIISVTVTATDASRASASSTFGLFVSNTNDVPTATPIAAQAASEDSAFSFTVPAGTFTDVDAGDTLSVTALLADGSPLPAWLSFDPTTRTFSGTPANGDVGVITVRVTATDASNTSASSSFTLTVANTNDAPTSTAIAAQVATEDSAFGFQVPATTFADVDVGDTLTYTATLGSGAALPAWLSFDAATRTFSGVPSNGDVGAITVRVTATDAAGASAASNFMLTVVNVNDAPTSSGIAAQSTPDSRPFSFTVPADAFADVDAGDVLRYSASLASGGPLPAWLSFDAATRTFSGTPAFADVGAIALRVTATDASGARVASDFTLTVTLSPPQPLVPLPVPPVEPPSAPAPTPLPVSGGVVPVPVPVVEFIPTTPGGVVLENALRPPVAAVTLDAGSPPTPVAPTLPAAPQALQMVPQLGTVTLGAGEQRSVELPLSAFLLSAPSGGISVEARQADGQPLPPWLRFDAASGKLVGRAPAGLRGVIQVVLTARDSQGQSATTRLEIRLDDARPVDGAKPAPVDAGEPAQTGRPQSLNRPQDAPERLAARPGLSEQLRQARGLTRHALAAVPRADHTGLPRG